MILKILLAICFLIPNLLILRLIVQGKYNLPTFLMITGSIILLLFAVKFGYRDSFPISKSNLVNLLFLTLSFPVATILSNEFTEPYTPKPFPSVTARTLLIVFLTFIQLFQLLLIWRIH